MIDVKVEPHRDGAMAGKYDIRASDPNGNLLVYSHQGYENASDAVDVARRLFGDPAGRKLREIRALVDGADPRALIETADLLAILGDDEDKPEHVDLTVVSWEGTGRTEPIR
ncbi:hypothetical protein A5722_14810 [Mycobacterium vulneris]|nr:hypothetical protein A5722_14810 [Mycolicibacterium vulneris]OCB66200.1 hypothetical protein A5729_12315 [Mycolicibacterium vulneris]